MERRKILIPAEVYETAIAMEKERFICSYCGQLERNGGSDRKAELKMLSRAAEFPLLLHKYGPGVLCRKNYERWSKLAASGMDQEDNCTMVNRLRRLSEDRAGL